MTKIARRIQAGRLLLTTILLATGAGLGATSCGSSDPATTCPMPLTMCGTACVDTSADSQNCGACGNACDPGDVCNGAGVCELTCQAGLTDCGGTCTDTMSSNAHCGGCDLPCDPGEVCNGSGACEPTCQTGLILCGGTCTDPLVSNQFCGATGDCAAANAGEPCPAGEVCNGSGVCALTCQAGLVACNGTCIDPQSNPSFCGASGDCAGVNDGESCAAAEACVAGGCQPLAVLDTSFLLNERNASKQHIWDPADPTTLTLLHATQANDVDCNADEGSPLGWFAEHFNDHFGNFTYGSGTGIGTQFTTPYAYPKHVTVFAGSVYVMSRNDATIKRYDLAGAETGSLATGLGTGQGLATDGTFLYASFWNGSVSSFRVYDAALVEQAQHANPTGMTGNNIVDFVFEPATGAFLGLDATGEGGTGTQTNRIVRFSMGGAVSASFTLAIQMDGIGRNNCP